MKQMNISSRTFNEKLFDSVDVSGEGNVKPGELTGDPDQGGPGGDKPIDVNKL